MADPFRKVPVPISESIAEFAVHCVAAFIVKETNSRG